MHGAFPLDAETRAADGGHRDELRLWLRLLTCTNLVQAELRTRLRARFDVTLPRFDAMAQLERSPDGMTLGALSRRMMVSNGNVTGLVETLVGQGLVERVPHPTDRRAALVRLTGAGREAFATMAAAHAEWVAELCGVLAPGETQTMMRLLGRLKTAAGGAP